MGVCEVIEIRNSADAVGYSCPGAASKECSDCGIQVCEDHAEPCGTSVFLDFLPALPFLTSSAALEPGARGTSRAKKGLEHLTKPPCGSLAKQDSSTLGSGRF